jgi:hypothetical protein
MKDTLILLALVAIFMAAGVSLISEQPGFAWFCLIMAALFGLLTAGSAVKRS